jgi:aryl-alcohol dehydrogenase-like predicted oxidoreductase
MRYRDFGKTGLKVSEIGFGAWAIGGNEHGNSYGPTEDKASIEAIHKAVDGGCNFFDTADVYGWGHSEELLGKALRAKRDRLIIATKVGGDFYQGTGFQTFTDDYIRFALEKSLARLKTDYIDVYQLHNPPLKLLNRPETYNTVKELKKEGKIRAWGVSIFDPVEALAALKVGQPDSIQLAYNLFNTKPAASLIPKAHAVGCAIIAREPLANGFLSGKFAPEVEFLEGDMRRGWPQDYVQARIIAAQKLAFLTRPGRSQTQAALQYLLKNPLVSTVITGAKTAQQVGENLAASDLPTLTEEELAQIRVLQAQGFS